MTRRERDLFFDLPPPSAPETAGGPSDLAAILAAVRAATSPDRRLDVALSIHVLPMLCEVAVRAMFDVPRFTGDEAAARGLLDAVLPDWWWTVGKCKLNAHASCGPDRDGRDADLLTDTAFDEGFHADCEHGIPALALCVVALEGLTARRAKKGCET